MIAGRMSGVLTVALALFITTTFVSSEQIRADEPIAGSDINLSPLRVVFGNSGRSQTVFIFNHGSAAATYKIDLVDRVMTNDGRLLINSDATKDPALAATAQQVKSAKDFIVFTPRRVTLQPNESQTIRVQARPAALEPGEYRTHLTVTTVPPDDAGLTAEQAARRNKGELSFRIVPVFSLSIPLIVRQGPVDARAGLEGAHLASDAGKPELFVTAEVVRLGASSVYGDVEVRQGDDVIGAVKGIAVYPEIARRSVRVPLNAKPKSGDELTLVFLDADQNPGAELARETLKAP